MASFDQEPQQPHSQVQREIGASLEGAVRQSYATIDVAASTNRELQRQDETICALDHSLDETEYQLKRSERHVRAIRSWRGMFANWFTRTPQPPSETARPRSTADMVATCIGTAPAQTAVGVTGGDGAASAAPASGSPIARRAAPAHRSDPAAAEEKQVGLTGQHDCLLDELHANVLRLRAEAQLQNDTLRTQNEALGGMQERIGVVQQKLDQNHRNVRTLL